jgi:hypothetical protein
VESAVITFGFALGDYYYRCEIRVSEFHRVSPDAQCEQQPGVFSARNEIGWKRWS